MSEKKNTENHCTVNNSKQRFQCFKGPTGVEEQYLILNMIWFSSPNVHDITSHLTPVTGSFRRHRRADRRNDPAQRPRLASARPARRSRPGTRGNETQIDNDAYEVTKTDRHNDETKVRVRESAPRSCRRLELFFDTREWGY